MTTMLHNWTRGDLLPDGHRLFATGASHVIRDGNHGHCIMKTHDGRGWMAWALVDESGPTPDLSDDGVLWLDMGRHLSVENVEDDDLVNEICWIPLLDMEGEKKRTITNATTLLLLSQRFSWPIDAGENIYLSTKLAK